MDFLLKSNLLCIYLRDNHRETYASKKVNNPNVGANSLFKDDGEILRFHYVRRFQLGYAYNCLACAKRVIDVMGSLGN